MAEITAQLFKIFGKDGSTDNFGKFGSATAGTPVNTKAIDTIQALTAWLNGWQDAVNPTKKAQFIEDMNSLCYVFAYQIAHILEKGIPEWQTDRTYYTNDIVKKHATRELYSSIGDSNTGNALPSQADDANWKYLGKIGDIIGAATAAMQEAGSATAYAVTPAVQQRHPSACKAWAYFDGTTTPATINASYNISSIDNLGGGRYKITLTTPFSSANYAVVGTCEFQTGVASPFIMLDPAPQTTTEVYIFVANSTNSGAIQPVRANVLIFGDQ